MRVLITGGTGLLGKALVETAPSEWEILATHHRNRPPLEWIHRFHPLDLQNAAAAEKLLQDFRPNAVIHAASIGSVDEAERNESLVRSVNLEGTRSIGTASRRAGAFFVHVSSNAVFDGASPPYHEQSEPAPINRYGRIKLETERWVHENLPSSLRVRPILMYGWPLPRARDNAVTRWLSDLENGRPVQVARDIISMPLWAGSCAEVIWNGIRRRHTGIVHVAGADRMNLYEFARTVARAFDCEESLVQPIAHQELAGLAPRPRDTSFLTVRMEKEFGVRPLPVEEGLGRMLQSRVTDRT